MCTSATWNASKKSSSPAFVSRISLQNLEKAIVSGSLGMYFLEQIGASEWRKTAGLMIILKGQMGEDFQKILNQKRGEILPIIGVDGYDYIPELLAKYQQSLGN